MANTPEVAPQYPQSEKLSEQSDERDAITQFIEFLSEKGIHLARYEEGFNLPHVIMESSDSLIMEHLGIDEIALEKERRHMLQNLTQKG